MLHIKKPINALLEILLIYNASEFMDIKIIK